MRWRCSSARRPSRRAIYISTNGRPIASPGTTARGGVVVFRDVTERVRAEEALAQAFAQGRLEVMDTILHNIGNAITSVAIGVGTLKEELANNPLIERLVGFVGDRQGTCGGLGATMSSTTRKANRCGRFCWLSPPILSSRIGN